MLHQDRQGHRLYRGSGCRPSGTFHMLRLKKYPKRGPYWYVRGTVAGVQLFESAGTTDRDQAEQYRRKREKEVYDEAALGKVRVATFADAVIAFKRTGRETRFLMPLLDHFKDTPLPRIGQAEVDAAAEALYPGRKASTLNRQVYGPMISVLTYAARAKLEGASRPLISMRKAAKPVVTPADDAHIKALLPHCSEGLQALILLMTYTGLRTGEALRVKPEDIKDGFIHVGITKNGHSRMVPVPAQWAYPNGGWGLATTQGVGRAIRRASKSAGIAPRDGHELGRHAFAARWLRNGGSIKALKEAGGWQKLSIVDETYGHLEISKVHDFMRALSVPPVIKSADGDGQDAD